MELEENILKSPQNEMNNPFLEGNVQGIVIYNSQLELKYISPSAVELFEILDLDPSSLSEIRDNLTNNSYNSAILVDFPPLIVQQTGKATTKKLFQFKKANKSHSVEIMIGAYPVFSKKTSTLSEIICSLRLNQDTEFKTTNSLFVKEKRDTEISTNQETEHDFQIEYENKFAKIFHNSSILFILTDFTTNVILDVNRTFLRATGFTEDECMGKTTEDLQLWVSKKDRDQYLSILNRDRIVKNYLAAFKTKSGEVRHGRVSAEITEIENRTVIIHSIDDISEIIRNEKTIKKKEELLSLTGSLAKVGGWEFNVSTKVGTWTEQVALLHEMRPDDPTTAEIGLSYYQGEHLERITKAINDAINEGKQYDLELELSLPSGEKKWVRTVGKLVEEDGEKMLKGIFQDITKDRKAFEEITLEKMKLKSLINALPEFIFLKDVEGRFLLCNPQIERLYNRPEKEILGKTDHELTSKEIADGFRENDLKALNSPNPVKNLEWVTFPNGESQLLETIKLAIKDQNGANTGVLGIARDITEIHNFQEDLKAREEIFSAIVSQAADAIGLISVNDARFIEFNTRAHEMLGYTHDEFANLTVADIDAIEDKERIIQSFKQIVSAGKYSFETKHKKKSGEILQIRVSASHVRIRGIDYIAAIWSDITESLKAQEALNQTQARLSSFMKFVPAKILIKDNDLRIIYANEKMAAYFPVDQWIGRKPHEAFPKEVADEMVKKDRQALRDGYINYEEIWTDINNNTRIYNTQKFRININNSEPLLGAIVTDITEKKQTEAKIKELNLSLEHRVAERTSQLQSANQELKAFAYTVSHDLRAPLRAIDSFTHILMEDYKDILDQKGLETCEIIKKNCHDMGKLIDDLLSFSRIGRSTISIQEIDMENLVQHIIKEQVVTLKTTIPTFIIEELPPIPADKALIKQVWVNLISNAIKFSSKQEKPLIKISSGEDKDYIYYSIKDNGIGFNMKYADKLFGVFQRLHSYREFEGTGVGLAIVKRIIKRHNGDITATSQVGLGTEFVFHIPKVPKEDDIEKDLF